MKEKNCNIIHLSEVESTNDYVKQVINCVDLTDGTMVVADHQTAGKGIGSNIWESESGKNILMSLIFYPGFLPADQQFAISIATALGISDFLKSKLPEEHIMIKWPNDIYVGKKKIAGILISNEILGLHIEHVIVGIGLNVNQHAFGASIPNPVSMTMLTGEEYDLNSETLQLRDFVTARYLQLKEGCIDLARKDYLDRLFGLDDWREYLHHGKKINAMITGVDEFGRLQLDTEGGGIVCDLKEIGFIL